jgi:hypothetical protein
MAITHHGGVESQEGLKLNNIAINMAITHHGGVESQEGLKLRSP